MVVAAGDVTGVRALANASRRRFSAEYKLKCQREAERGAAMVSRAVALVSADLGVTENHDRPHVCNNHHLTL